uniref:uncharacterized protein LOC143395663 isoform X1 n=1 Tax=Callospermophilus lateralis TaxID=76772 RepID=UPI004038A02D
MEPRRHKLEEPSEARAKRRENKTETVPGNKPLNLENTNLVNLLRRGNFNKEQTRMSTTGTDCVHEDSSRSKQVHAKSSTVGRGEDGAKFKMEPGLVLSPICA